MLRPRLRPTLLAFVIVTLAAPTPAQNNAPPAPDWRNAGPPLEFLAERVANPDAATGRTVANVAWTLLSYTARGSTMRVGPHKQSVKRLTKWLRDLQGNGGSFAPAKQPCSRMDQLVGTLAIAEVTVLSNYRLLHKTVHKASAELLAQLTGPDTAPVTAEEAALLLLLEQALEHVPGAPATACREAAMDGLAKLPEPTTDRKRAALRLASLMQGQHHAPATTKSLAWPKNPMADPLHTFIAVRALSFTDRPTFAAGTNDLRKLMTVCTPAGTDRGSWPGTKEFDSVTATAILTTALGLAACDPLGK